ncbi:PREDICTED: transcription factor MYB98-like [Erythranthe guttata]|uniref:transcription factor MYB98-like n=1 Tax=Erythranthe guttata TaxID=4155 RepID=UPI00064DCCC7|nr:PREDICTED: transcription factor MYB98-like [Erythranthe guttata]|eukprot:XP_012829185.1 PREDICTED: transcription factor MYB98-like [Erythranthe guttata]
MCRLLIHLVEKHGVRKWSSIAQMLKGRIGKQCRERWHNHLRPDIKKDIWTEEEDRVLIETHAKVGNKWAEIAKSLPGRTENSIKNHWNATKRRQFSRRKCRTKWPKPSTLLQNYIKNLHVGKEGSSTERTINIDDHSRTFHNTSSVSSPPRINPEIEFCKGYEFDDVTDFTFDSFMDDFDADELEFDMPPMCEVKKEVDFFDGIA